MNSDRSADNGERIGLPGLYIHVPFCQTKCPYCDFYSVTDQSFVSPWIEGIEKELAIYRDRFPVFDSLFMGGGTPTLLSEKDLAHLIASITSLVTISYNSEITLEANPDDVNPAKLKAIKTLGINRISLGVQSFHDRELQFLQRRHTAQQSESALETIRSTGFTNLGIDLMYGLEGQMEADWIETLERALSYSPEHLSCYQLTIETNTPFGRMNASKKSLVDEEAQRSFFLLTSSFLEDQDTSIMRYRTLLNPKSLPVAITRNIGTTPRILD